MRTADLQAAARYGSFKLFRKHEPEIHDRILKSGELKALYQMFVDGSIWKHKAPRANHKDMRRAENRSSSTRTRPDDIYRVMKFYRTFSDFMRNGGAHAAAVEKNGMRDKIKVAFKRLLTPDEINEEAARYPDWETFEFERPRYAEDAVKQGLRADIEKKQEGVRKCRLVR